MTESTSKHSGTGPSEAVSSDQLEYEAYVRQSVELGLREAETGRTHSHDSAGSRVRARISAAARRASQG